MNVGCFVKQKFLNFNHPKWLWGEKIEFFFFLVHFQIEKVTVFIYSSFFGFFVCVGGWLIYWFLLSIHTSFVNKRISNNSVNNDLIKLVWLIWLLIDSDLYRIKSIVKKMEQNKNTKSKSNVKLSSFVLGFNIQFYQNNPKIIFLFL